MSSAEIGAGREFFGKHLPAGPAFGAESRKPKPPAFPAKRADGAAESGGNGGGGTRGVGRIKFPEDNGRHKKRSPGEEEPPMSPLAALCNALIISRVSSSSEEKRKISHKAMQRMGALERDYSNEGAQSYMHTLWPFIVASGIAIGESNRAMNRDLEAAASLRDSKIKSAVDCMQSSITHHVELRTMRLKNLEKTKMVRNIPSITTWLASIGISAATIYALEAEAISFIAKNYPKLEDLKHLTYCVAASLAVAAVVGIKKLINWGINKREEHVVNEFQERKTEDLDLFQKRKSRAQNEFNERASELVRGHLAKAMDIAGHVYAQVYLLCDNYYPAFVWKDPNYERYMALKTSNGAEKAYEYLMEAGRREAERQFANWKFLYDFRIGPNGRIEHLHTNEKPSTEPKPA